MFGTILHYFKFTFLVLLCGASMGVRGQDLVITRIELEKDKIFLFYELTDTTRGHYYTISLYSSRDNYLNRLQTATGDLGLEVLPGGSRQIVISPKQEFGPDFEGKLAFELRGELYIPFIRLDGFNDYRKFKRGKPYEIHWTGGRPQNVINIELYKGNRKVQTFANIANRGKYMLIFPPDTRPGKDYRLKISDPKNRDEVVNTKIFAITSKVPLAFKIIPVAVLGGVLYIALKPKDSDSANYLPEFPNSPNNP